MLWLALRLVVCARLALLQDFRRLDHAANGAKGQCPEVSSATGAIACAGVLGRHFGRMVQC